MNYIYYLPFLVFIVASYVYYQRKNKKQDQRFNNIRDEYISENSTLTEEQTDSLSKGFPWIGMDSPVLIELFGEPRRKRVLDQSLTRTIWSYGNLFVYINNGKVTEWKSR